MMSNESQGDNPAFLQMNQNGRIATGTAITSSNINSGIPIGPMVFDVFWYLSC